MVKKITSRIHSQEMALERAGARAVTLGDAARQKVRGINRLTAAVLLLARAVAGVEEEKDEAS